MLTVFMLLAIAAFVGLVLWVMGKAPGWVSVAFLCLIELLRALPLGH